MASKLIKLIKFWHKLHNERPKTNENLKILSSTRGLDSLVFVVDASFILTMALVITAILTGITWAVVVGVFVFVLAYMYWLLLKELLIVVIFAAAENKKLRVDDE